MSNVAVKVPANGDIFLGIRRKRPAQFIEVNLMSRTNPET
jgi:hypothetical protein